jgi:hypothetical protein
MQPRALYEKQLEEKFLHSGVSFFYSGKLGRADFSAKKADLQQARSLPTVFAVKVLRMCA